MPRTARRVVGKPVRASRTKRTERKVGRGVHGSRRTTPSDKSKAKAKAKAKAQTKLGSGSKLASGSGSACAKSDRGPVRRSNEDRVQVTKLACGWRMLAVYDGHGGAQAADFVRQHMSTRLGPAVCSSSSGSSSSASSSSINTTAMRRGIVSAIRRLDQDMRFQFCHRPGRTSSDHKACREAGTTSVVVLWRAPYAVFANVGDSRAILVDRDTGRLMFSTVDHKPTVASERAAVERRGGRVTGPTATDVARVNDELAMTRALGDFPLKPAVSNEATVTTLRLSRPATVILASDGVWDVLSSSTVARLYTAFRRRRANGADAEAEAAFCQYLTRTAIRLRSDDNCSVVTAVLR